MYSPKVDTTIDLDAEPPPPQSKLEQWMSSNDDKALQLEQFISHRKIIRRWNQLSSLPEAPLNNSSLVIEPAAIDAAQVKKAIMESETIERPIFTGPSNARQFAVVESFKHAWRGYKAHAWGHDNLKPVSGAPHDWFSLGLTIVDGLDTAYIMGLMEEFEEGRQWVNSELVFTKNKDVNLFEVTIRVLGALLTNHHFTQDPMFLDKAKDLGERLMAAFSSPSGIPYSDVNLGTRTAHAPEWSHYSTTAEVTTVQLEFRELSRATNNPVFEDAAAAVSEKIHQLPKKHGLVPIFINPNTGHFLPHATITLGARGDSYYEYLLKQWLQTGKTINYLLDDYMTAMEGVREYLAKRSSPNKRLFIGELASGSEAFNPKMDHLTCFLPGTLALGHANGLPDWHMTLAEQLLYTCYLTYAAHPTFLAPEITHFNMVEMAIGERTDTHRAVRVCRASPRLIPRLPYAATTGQMGVICQPDDMYTKTADAHSLLRPEFVESLWYMYQLTGNSTYQDWGWQIYQGLEKYARVENGYTSLNNVKSDKPIPRDMMESFFLSETLKYLYLLFADDRYTIDLSKYVINSEAHPLPIHKN
ncbi:endoplasmic reticulum mannosyl-oligosaccharide 1,2-alpha-mannosidase-like [Maniola hyperantus]|uniref:endoplasmic reticulum mannosyl-oligosaccharide 1,2-alpha-mannosidase-like n=1 Tax=Aphantopus hyperantus TaxID=2795564 RepID=UPI00374A2465